MLSTSPHARSKSRSPESTSAPRWPSCAELRGEMAGMRTDMERMVRTLQTWMVGTVVSVGGLVVAL